jgi:hypothetical protein
MEGRVLLSWEIQLLRRQKYNQAIERTRVALVSGPKCARTSLAHFGPGQHRPRAAHLGRYTFLSLDPRG